MVTGTKRQVFYSFKYQEDVFRVQQIRNMGAVEGNQSVYPNEWEKLKRQGEASIKQWIDDSMNYRSCVVVLIGSQTSNSEWVKYEIKRAWEQKKGLFGIHVHNLNCPKNGISRKGSNPFDNWKVGQKSMSSLITCYDPPAINAYNSIANNMSQWVEAAIRQAANR